MYSTIETLSNEKLPVEPLVQCSVCKGREFDLIHSGVRDFLFGAPGSWSYQRCNSCGTISLDPRPVGNGLEFVYTAAYSARKGTVAPGAGRRHAWLARLRRSLLRGVLAGSFGYKHTASPQDCLLAKLLGWLPGLRERAANSIMGLHYMSPSATLLDVGCGVGQFMGTLKALGWTVVGVDTDARVVETARTAGLDARCGQLKAFGFPDESFDVITLRHVIEHVSDPSALLSEVKRLLKPGGMMLMATPNAASLGQSVFGSHWLGLDVSRHMHIFTSQSLAGLARQVGFERLDIRSSARITRIVATVSQAHRKHKINAYYQRAPLTVRLYGAALMVKAKLHLALGRDDGEEILLRAYR